MKSISLHLGVANPTSTNSFDKAVKAGPAAILQYLYYPSDWVAVGAELGYFQLGKKGLPAPAGVQASGKANGQALMFLTRINLLRERSWTPYVLGGAGYHQFKVSIANSSKSYDPFTALGVPDGLKSGLAVTAGAGLEAFLLQGLSLALEARYHEFRKNSDPRKTGETLSAFLAVRFWFKPR